MASRIWRRFLPRSTEQNDGACLGSGIWYYPGRQDVQPGMVLHSIPPTAGTNVPKSTLSKLSGMSFG